MTSFINHIRTDQNFSVLRELDLNLGEPENQQISVDKKGSLIENNCNKNSCKHRTFQPSNLTKVEKITKFQKLIHSDVSEMIMKSFIIELYRGVKYSLKSLKGPDRESISNKRVRLNEIQGSKKKFLFLDLDETLIFSSRQKINKRVNNGKISFQLYIRPYARQFLQNLSKYFDLYIFTAATREYAEEVMQKLNFQRRLINDFLCRDDCFKTQKGKLIKDLRIVENRSLKDIVIVDNKVESFGLQIDNGIPILDFYGSAKDIELVHLEKTLIQLSKSYDVREAIRQKFELRNLAQISKEDLQEYLKCGKSLGKSEKYIAELLNC